MKYANSFGDICNQISLFVVSVPFIKKSAFEYKMGLGGGHESGLKYMLTRRSTILNWC